MTSLTSRDIYWKYLTRIPSLGLGSAILWKQVEDSRTVKDSLHHGVRPCWAILRLKGFCSCWTTFGKPCQQPQNCSLSALHVLVSPLLSRHNFQGKTNIIQPTNEGKTTYCPPGPIVTISFPIQTCWGNKVTRFYLTNNYTQTHIHIHIYIYKPHFIWRIFFASEPTCFTFWLQRKVTNHQNYPSPRGNDLCLFKIALSSILSDIESDFPWLTSILPLTKWWCSIIVHNFPWFSHFLFL